MAEAMGLPAVEALDIWPYINGDAPTSPRTEIIHDHHMFTNASAQYLFSLPLEQCACPPRELYT